MIEFRGDCKMTKEGWFKYTLSEQMSNIGAEVRHFIEARDNYRNGVSAEDYSDFYYNKAITYINIIPCMAHAITNYYS